MDYLELECKVHPGGENVDILVAHLADIGFSMFEETEEGVKAYIDVAIFNQEQLDALPILNTNELCTVHYTINETEKKNWNEEWESNFHPVVIGTEIYVRAEYHAPDPAFKYELIIQPRMAFGTGHHATTSLMMEAMLEIDFENKSVLDMGCGTAILAILAEKKGASNILAIDNDPVAVENSVLNCAINNAVKVNCLTGDATTPGEEKFDVILANINRNIILADLPFYVKNLKSGGFLLMSGFYLKDLNVIEEKAGLCGLNLLHHRVLNDWCQVVFVTNN